MLYVVVVVVVVVVVIVVVVVVVIVVVVVVVICTIHNACHLHPSPHTTVMLFHVRAKKGIKN